MSLRDPGLFRVHAILVMVTFSLSARTLWTGSDMLGSFPGSELMKSATGLIPALIQGLCDSDSDCLQILYSEESGG